MFQGREDPAAKVLQADLGIQDPPDDPEFLDLLALLDLPAIAIQTRVWATMLEVHKVPLRMLTHLLGKVQKCPH